MDLEILMNNFCKKYGYDGSMEYVDEKNELAIIITKNLCNAGAFLNESEYAVLDEEILLQILEVLHEGFKLKYELNVGY